MPTIAARMPYRLPLRSYWAPSPLEKAMKDKTIAAKTRTVVETPEIVATLPTGNAPNHMPKDAGTGAARASAR